MCREGMSCCLVMEDLLHGELNPDEQKKEYISHKSSSYPKLVSIILSDQLMGLCTLYD